MAMTFGYARVSSVDQNEQRQLIALRRFPVKDRFIYVDKVSGANFDRPAYQNLLTKLCPGDVVVTKSIDRLGRNYADIKEQWRYLTHDLKVDLVILDTPLLDTRTNEDNLTGVFIADLVLEILSYVAETERDNIKQRQSEGIAAARSRGVRFGRPPKVVPKDFKRLYAQWEEGITSSRKAARVLGVSSTTFMKWVKQERLHESFQRQNEC